MLARTDDSDVSDHFGIVPEQEELDEKENRDEKQSRIPLETAEI